MRLGGVCGRSDSRASLVAFDVKEDVGLALGDGGGVRRRHRGIVEVEPVSLVDGVGRVMTATNPGSNGKINGTEM